MSCKEYLKELHIRVEQSKTRGRFLVSEKAIPAGRRVLSILQRRNDHYDVQSAVVCCDERQAGLCVSELSEGVPQTDGVRKVWLRALLLS